MKKIINRTTMAVILALSMVLALLGGIFFAKHNNVAEAASSTTVEITADTTSFCPGAKFTLSIIVSTTRTGVNFSTISFNVGPKKSATSIDVTKAGYLTLSNLQSSSQLNKTVNSTGIVSPATTTNGMLRVSLGAMADDSISADEPFVVCTVDVEISKNIDMSGDLTFEIGIRENQQSFVAYSDGGRDVANAGAIEVKPLKFTIKEPSNNHNLTSLKVGQGDDDSRFNVIDTNDASLDKDNIAVTVTDPSLPLSVLPVTEDPGAKVTLKPGDINVNSGEIGKITIPSNGIITVVITAENGTDSSTYTLKVKVVGAMLTALTAKTDTATTGVTKNGLKETFDSTTLAYTVYVPSDSTKVTFKATVSTGHNELTTLDLFTANGYTVPTNVNSGAEFNASGVSDGDTLVITCKASDGTTNSSKDYTITFEIVDVDASIDALTVVGTTTNKTFNNSSFRATENNVDYYYMVVGETNASSSVTVAATSSDATITLDGAAYTAAKTLTEGRHEVTITAEAGNSTSYVFFLKNYVPLELIDDTDYDFIYQEVVVFDEDPDAIEYFYYRRSYAEKGMQHGFDDVDFERVVVGQILQYTSVNDFLANFKNTSSIKLYNAAGELFFNCGSVGDDFIDDDLDDPDSFSVGTGWYIEYIVGGKVEETIYISVLGDLDGDGFNLPEDMSVISRFIQGLEDIDLVEYRLAGFVENTTGTMDAGDITVISGLYKGEITADDYFYKKSN